MDAITIGTGSIEGPIAFSRDPQAYGWVLDDGILRPMDGIGLRENGALYVHVWVDCPVDYPINFYVDLHHPNLDNYVLIENSSIPNFGSTSINVVNYDTEVAVDSMAHVYFNLGEEWFYFRQFIDIQYGVYLGDGTFAETSDGGIWFNGGQGTIYFRAPRPDYYYVNMVHYYQSIYDPGLGVDDIYCLLIGPIRVVDPNGNNPPIARPEYFQTNSSNSLAMDFVANAWDHEGDTIAYSWDFGDTNSASNVDLTAQPQHVYPDFGVYEVSLIVSDGLAQSEYHMSVEVNDTAISGVPDDQDRDDRTNSAGRRGPILMDHLNCYPNPFNPQTTIAFALAEQTAVSLRVFDMSGRLVRILVDGEMIEPGPHESIWNGRDDSGRRVASGAYLYRLEAGEFSATKRMVILK